MPELEVPWEPEMPWPTPNGLKAQLPTENYIQGGRHYIPTAHASHCLKILMDL